MEIDLSFCERDVPFTQLMKEFPLLNVLNIHENLLEALLELQLYADAQALLFKYDGQSKGVCLCRCFCQYYVTCC